MPIKGNVTRKSTNTTIQVVFSLIFQLVFRVFSKGPRPREDLKIFRRMQSNKIIAQTGFSPAKKAEGWLGKLNFSRIILLSGSATAPCLEFIFIECALHFLMTSWLLFLDNRVNTKRPTIFAFSFWRDIINTTISYSPLFFRKKQTPGFGTLLVFVPVCLC